MSREGRPQSYLADGVLLARIELGPLVDVSPAGVAPDAHRQHHADLDLLILGLPPPGDLRRIEVGRIVLVQDLPFTHGSPFLPPSTLGKYKTLTPVRENPSLPLSLDQLQATYL